jgi:hypothetical protein
MRTRGRLQFIWLLVLGAWALAACAAPFPSVPGPDISPAGTVKAGESVASESQTTTAPAPLRDESGSAPDPELDAERAATCENGEENLVAGGITETYAVTYAQVMTWFCAGSEFEDILLALETHAAVDVAVDELLNRRGQGQSWDAIWKETGLVP